MIKAVVFDLDGTILDLKLKFREAKKKFLKLLEENGVKLGEITLDTPTEMIMKRVKDKPRSWLMKLVDEAFIPYEVEAAEEAELREGVEEVLRKLKEYGYRLGIASNNGRIGVRKALEKVGIIDLFDIIVTRNDVNSMKPSGKLIRRAVELLGVKPWEMVYVGDTYNDVEAARKAGVKTIAILGGAHPPERIQEAKPDAVLDDFRKLPETLKLLNGET